MAWLDFGITSLLILFVFVCFLLCLLILMQRTKNDGIGSAIASGVTQKYIGVQTSNVLVKGTVWLTVFFFLFAILLDHLYTMRAKSILEHGSQLHQQLVNPVVTPGPLTVGPGPTALPTPAQGLKPASTPPVVPTPLAPPTPAPAVTATPTSKSSVSPGSNAASHPASQSSAPTKPGAKTIPN